MASAAEERANFQELGEDWFRVKMAGKGDLPAHKPPANARPRLILGQGIEPDIDHAIATMAVTLDVAGNVPVSEPFGGTAGQIVAGPFGISATVHPPMIAPCAGVVKPLAIAATVRRRTRDWSRRRRRAAN
jgi:hypothetical protein